MANIGDLSEFERGQRLKADDLNVHVDLLRQHEQKAGRKHEAPNSTFGPDGWLQRLWAPGDEKRRFELGEDLAPGDLDVPAFLLRWDPISEVLVRTETPLKVSDVMYGHRGRRFGKFVAPNNQGSQGYVVLPEDSNKWEITWMQPAATLITGLLMRRLSRGDPYFDISSVTVMSPPGRTPPGGLIADTGPQNTDPSIKVIVKNREFWAEAGVEAIAGWDEATRQWIAVDVPCPEGYGW